MPRKPATSTPRSGSGFKRFLLGFLCGALTMWLIFGDHNGFDRIRLLFGDPPEPSTEDVAALYPQPKFEFYTLLPEMEVEVPEEELVADPEPAPTKPESTPAASPVTVTLSTSVAVAKPATAKTSKYLLQAGSFRLRREADSLKAKLALGGFEVQIQTIQINGAATWHRVRVGPYIGKAALKKARLRLQKRGIKPLVLRVKK